MYNYMYNYMTNGNKFGRIGAIIGMFIVIKNNYNSNKYNEQSLFSKFAPNIIIGYAVGSIGYIATIYIVSLLK
jgi:hypothetical protein